jgi:phytoene dehydrogenase-like protein
MADKRDVIIIGGGHNGLVAAYYLAKAGLKVRVLERRPIVGGGAITEEIHPGFRCSTLAHATGPLLPKISRDMQLRKHGLTMLEPRARVCSLAPDGRALVLYQEASKSAEEIAKFSAKDASRYGEFQEVTTRIAGVLADLLTQTPPVIESPAAGDLLQLLKTAKNIRRLGKKNVYRLLRWAPMAVADLVAEWFDTELLRATVAARGIFGNAVGPWSAGTGAVLLLWAAMDANLAGPASFPAGGMGALTEALSKAACEAGVEVRTNHDVSRIVVKDGEACGVVLSDGTELAANIVVSNADPKHTLLRLVDPLHLDPSFVEKMRHYRCSGTVAKLNFAMSDLPKFAGLNGRLDREALSGRIHIGPEIDYLERAFDHSKYGEISLEPYLDISIPTITDSSLAPAGKHVMSVHMQFAPFQLKEGNWGRRREELRDLVTKTISGYAPNFRELMLGCQVITPEDLEQTYGFAGGHIFHGDLALDQLFTMRPLLGWARYRTPIRKLYLCGSGTHPGLGLNGASGVNAAREIVKDLR